MGDVKLDLTYPPAVQSILPIAETPHLSPFIERIIDFSDPLTPRLRIVFKNEYQLSVVGGLPISHLKDIKYEVAVIGPGDSGLLPVFDGDTTFRCKNKEEVFNIAKKVAVITQKEIEPNGL